MSGAESGEWEHIVHGFAPIWDARSRVLVLGTLPSVKSREAEFYYGHPRNRFWRLLALLCGVPEPRSRGGKKRMQDGYRRRKSRKQGQMMIPLPIWLPT